jgi:dolichyl-phosphate beta-glucosyltransferase
VPAKDVDLSIIIPAYMEAANIGTSLDTLSKFLSRRDYGTVEVLVVVPDSSDGTAEIARSKAALFDSLRVIDAGHRVGKGRDVRIGMFEAKGHYKLFMDADLATPLDHLDDVKRIMDASGDLGIAVRNLWRIHDGLARKLFSKGGNIFTQAVLVPGIKDTQCGFKVFREDVAMELFGRQTMLSWSFDAELLAIARKLGYKISYVQAPDWKDPKTTGMGLVGDSPLKSALGVLLDVVRIRINIWTGVYNEVRFHYEASKKKS